MIVLFAAAIIETAILSNIALLPVVPDILLISHIAIAVKNGKVQGQTLGFVSGLFLDMLTGVPLGFNCLIRTIIGYSAGSIGTAINTTGIFIPAVCGVLATLLKALLTWLVSLCFPALINTLSVFSVDFLWEAGCALVLSPLLFKFLALFDGFILMPQRRVR
ncbi:MAG: rod shape-determining protein MreD [Treponema sp.]|nr:rod shape-determining protein MreD [Treponema sp.]